MKSSDIPVPAVKRLSLYLRQLEQFKADGISKFSSRRLADSLEIKDAQVRKDLAYFGQFGKPGVGYSVDALIDNLRRILGTDKTHSVVLVGAGDLGRAILRYRGFRKKGFEFIAAFDVSQAKVGKKIGDVPVYHNSELESVVSKHNVKLAVISVPAESAQEVTDRLCSAGIMGILNLAPQMLRIPPAVSVARVDLAASLEQLSFLVGRGTREDVTERVTRSKIAD